MWALPAIEEWRDRPNGNLTKIVRYALRAHPPWPWRTAATVVSTESIRVFGAEVGLRPHPGYLTPDTYGTWIVALASVGLAVLVGVAIWRRRVQPELVPLGLIALSVDLAAIVVTRKIDGPNFVYLTDWIVAVGLIAAVLGIAVVTRWPWPRVGAPAKVVGTAAWVVAVALVVVKAPQRPAVDTTDNAAVAHMAPLVRRWLGTSRSASLDELPDPASLSGTLEVSAGIALALEEHGVALHVPPSWELPYSGVATIGGQGGPRLVVASVASPPRPGERVIASFAQYRVYGSGGP
jgi:hypothetical protein